MRVVTSAAPVCVAALLLFACAMTSLDLGTNYSASEAGAPVIDASDEAPVLSLETRLREKCRAPYGARDTYRSVKELTEKIAARWYACTPLDPTGSVPDGIEFTAEHTWQHLVWADERHEAFVGVASLENHGTMRCVAYSDPDAGAGIEGGVPGTGTTTTRTVPCSDVVAWRGIFVYLEPEFGVISNVLSFDLEREPRRAFAAQVGPTADVAELVPID